MQLKGYHLTYCTNIHSGESWAETLENLEKYIPKIKTKISPNAPFGIGLRLSDKASRTLLEGDNLSGFKNWLEKNQYYVYTFNGFPFGGFHHQSVKDQVHHPDWTTNARLEYTMRLFDILAFLLPEGVEGGISTSPLSYKFWESSRKKKEEVLQKATLQIAKIAEKLYNIHRNNNKILHLDIEPEPDGLLENTDEVISWYKEFLIPQGTAYLKRQFDFSDIEAEACLKKYVQICYDVCHFAVGYEKPQEVFSRLKAESIRIGKIQISAALKAKLPEKPEQRKWIEEAFAPFVESTYLHQVVERDERGKFIHYPDLPQALEKLNTSTGTEWRTHFHVPVFLAKYRKLESTQEDILEVLQYLKNEKVSDHLEVETYTWEVLPSDIQLEITESIVRELKWVQKNL